METWIKTSLILCIFGFLKEFRPSEPFVTPYLTEYRNYTRDEVNQIYPVGTYSYLSLLVIVFLVTDFLRYKPVIIILGLSGITCFGILAFGKNIMHMQIVEFFYGLFQATEVAYFTYMYAKVDKQYYQEVTSQARTAFLLGRFMSGVVSQSLVSTDALNTLQLLYITMASQTVATMWAFLLPSVSHSMYFHRNELGSSPTQSSLQNIRGIDNAATEPQFIAAHEVGRAQEPPPALPSTNTKMSTQCMRAYYYLWRDFKQAYTNPYVLKWSFWWALATCGFLQVLTYIQVLWDSIAEEIYGKDENPVWYNGAIEAIYTLIGAAASFSFGYLTLNWKLLGEMALGICSALQGICLFIGAYSQTLWLSYPIYVVYAMLYHPMITIANSEVAKHINEDSYALIFGINTFFALVLQTILTIVVVNESGLALSPKDQFIVYASSYLILSAFFLALGLFNIGSHYLCKAKRETGMPPKVLV